MSISSVAEHSHAGDHSSEQLTDTRYSASPDFETALFELESDIERSLERLSARSHANIQTRAIDQIQDGVAHEVPATFLRSVRA